MKSPIKTDSIPSPFSKSPAPSALDETVISVPEQGATAINATEQTVESLLKASDKAALVKQDRAAIALDRKRQADENFLIQLESLNSLDWDRLPVPLLAQLIMSKPFKQGKDEPDYYMSPQQSLIYASSINFLNVGCERPELKLNPFLNDVWPDTKTMKINVTVEGQRKLAARRGDLGIPQWEQIERPLGPGVEKRFPWQKADLGMKCTIPVGQKEVSCTAWISLWFKNTPIWRENWEHMLRVRSEGLCYEAITGVGISQPHADKEIENVAAYQPPAVASTEFRESPIQMKGENK